MGPLLAMSILAAGCGEEQRSTPSPAPVEPTAEPGGPSAPTYPATTAGLEQLLADLLTAIATDRAHAVEMAENLALPHPDEWFAATFGDTVGARLASEYQRAIRHFDDLVEVLARLADNGQTRIVVEQFDDADDPSAVGYQSAALAAMVAPLPLYSVRISQKSGQQTFHLWSFVYEQGSFRWIGKLQELAKPAPHGELDLQEFRKRDVEEIIGRGD